MTRQERAAELLARSREFLEAELLGSLCDHGEAEVLAALQKATHEYELWRAQGGKAPKTPTIAAIARGEL